MTPADELPIAVCIMGPTAAGKTGLAVELVQRFPFDIISVDSAMIYRGLDIGTAKPSAAILRIAPHRLINILDPAEAYSAARFRDDALREMAQIQAQGRIPLLVGGTMLYFRALERGLSELPSADPDVRAALDAEAAETGWPALHARLQTLDPAAAARIHPNDPQRIQRALEVVELTGRPLSEWHAQGRQAPVPYRFIKLALMPEDRSELHARIAQRFTAMLAAGLVDEVRSLRARGDLGLHLPSMRAVGYRQVWEYLDGLYAEAEMLERGVTVTRQYAKRQLTWLRAEPDTQRFSGTAAENLRQVLEKLQQLGTLRDGP